MKWTGSYDKCHIDHIDKKRWLFAMYTICFGIMVMLVFGRFLYYGKSFCRRCRWTIPGSTDDAVYGTVL